MGAKELNLLLLKKFPELNDKFIKETEWQEGIETGSIIVFEDVFFKYLKKNLHNDSVKKRIFDFLNELLTTNDEYIINTIETAVFENLITIRNRELFERYLTSKIKERLNEIGKQMFSNFKTFC